MNTNKYASTIRTYTVRNLHEAVLTTGSDIVIPNDVPLRVVPEFSADVNPETNFLPVRVGVFSNFADGLIFKTPANRIDVSMAFLAYNYDEEFSLDLTYGATAVTVSAGTAGWVNGNSYAVEIETVGFDGRKVVMMVDATGPAAGNLRDYWPYSTGTFDTKNLDLTSAGENYTHKNISTLNCMYQINEFAEPFQFGGGADYDVVVMRVVLNLDPTHTTEFLTNIIDSSFDDETVYFDVVTDIEFTGKE